MNRAPGLIGILDISEIAKLGRKDLIKWVMSLRDIWGTTPDKKRVLRSKSRNPQPEKKAQNLDKMADSDSIDNLATKISEEVTAKLSANMDTKLDKIVASVTAVCETVTDLEKRMGEAEQRISDTEDLTAQLSARLEQAETRLGEAIARIEDQENRSRRNNIKIVNLPERTEGDNAKGFFETWIPEVLNLKVKNDRIKVDRCHRTPAKPRPDAAKPRVIYIRLHNYSDKQLIMQSARNLGEVTVSGSRIHFFEDFSPALEKKRRDYMEVKKTLRTLGISYRMIFPAMLRINNGDETRLFKSPAEAQRYAERMQTDNA